LRAEDVECVIPGSLMGEIKRQYYMPIDFSGRSSGTVPPDKNNLKINEETFVYIKYYPDIRTMLNQ
jgi:hypothetical protein